jgi:hypothetical protein
MTQAVAMLAASPTTVSDESGRALEIDPVSAEGTRLVARVDRLRTGDAGTLTARVHGDDLRPWSLGLEIEQTEYHSVELATVTLRARSLRLDDRHRKADRTSLGGHARLIAVHCKDVVDGDVVEGSIVDVSDNGVAFLTQRLLRPGDRLEFTGRFFATVVAAEVRVARVSESNGQLQAGCTFIAIEPEERRKLRDITAVRPAGTAATFNVLEQLKAERVAREREQAPSRWRRLFRRSA